MVTHPLWRPFAPQANAERQTARVARRQTAPGPPRQHDDRWRGQYVEVRDLIMAVLADLVLAVGHVGSTAVPGLVAKPVIDIDLTVADAEDEASYVPRLQTVGFRLVFRDDLGGDPHRQLTLGHPNTNLHVWGPGAVEPQRHALFVRWLCDHAEDRARYAEVKATAAQGPEGRRYNDTKAAVVYDIYERIFAADPHHPHHPRPARVIAM